MRAFKMCTIPFFGIQFFYLNWRIVLAAPFKQSNYLKMKKMENGAAVFLWMLLPSIK